MRGRSRGWLRSALRRLTGRPGVDREGELDEELRSYVAMLTEEKLAAGLRPREARRAALLEAGGMEQVKEAVRSGRRGALVESVLRDVRHGGRLLIRDRGFTVVAVLALGLGIGASASIWSVVDGVLLSPLPYPDSEELVVMLHEGQYPVSPANLLDWRREASDVASIGAAEYWAPNLAGDDRAEKIEALRVTPDLMALLDVAPALGRGFGAGTEDAGRDDEVLLSWGLWQRQYAGDRWVIGRTMQLDGRVYTVVGVMPAGFRFAPFWATESELWAPLSLQARATQRRGASLRVFARLGEGVTLAQARARMATITARLESEYPGTNENVVVRPLKELVVSDVRGPLRVLLGAVTFLLLIACANVAHMQMARAATRQREVALRTALGASRARLVRQHLTESVMLAVTGGTVGLLLALIGVRLLASVAAGVPRMETVTVDGSVLLFTLIVSLTSGVAFGLSPAWQAARREPAAALREGERGSTRGPGHRRLRALLMTSEFALALVLLAGAGLMVRSFLALRRVDPGFDTTGLLAMQVTVTGTSVAAPGRRAVFYRDVLERVRALPGVESASAINHLPLAGDIWGLPYRAEGSVIPGPGDEAGATYRVVMPGYFETMRIRVLRGRSIAETDAAGAPGVVVINESVASRQWPGENPIGRRLGWASDADPQWLTVVGVVANAVRDDWRAPPSDEVYVPWLQSRPYLEDARGHYGYMTLVVRGTGDDAAALTSSTRSAVHTLARDVPVSDILTLEQVVDRAIAPARFQLFLLLVFAGAALLLAAVGIFGVVSYAVSRRTHEIGIRMVLGARRNGVIGMIMRDGLRYVVAGALIGLAGAIGLTRLMTGMLFGVGATDPITYVAAALLLGVVALIATAAPAWRAVHSTPLSTLREP